MATVRTFALLAFGDDTSFRTISRAGSEVCCVSEYALEQPDLILADGSGLPSCLIPPLTLTVSEPGGSEHKR